MQNFDKPKSGFTLIELSMVLVIIGLIIGGIFVGQDLVMASQLNKMMSEKDKYLTAIFAFKEKYNCVPGDCDNATTIFAGSTGVYNGNGNGYINANYPPSTAAYPQGTEPFQLWKQLSLAGWISGNYTGTGVSGLMSTYNIGSNCPRSSFRDSMGFALFYKGRNESSTGSWDIYNADHVNYGTVFVMGGTTVTSLSLGGSGGLTPLEAKFLDSKYDDGNPITGKIYSSSRHSCRTSSTYNTNTSGASCVITIKTGFENF